jgi:hypothetical protein
MSDFCPAVGNPPPCLKFHVARKAGKLNCTLGVLIPFAMLTSTLRLRRHDFENVELNVQMFRTLTGKAVCSADFNFKLLTTCLVLCSSMQG